MGALVNIKQAEQLRLAAEYREQMYRVAIKRGYTEAEAMRFAAEQVETQLILSMKAGQRKDLARLRKPRSLQ